ncbi:tetratricopeptide repeat protein [Pseudomonas marincola]|uniref:tetratricopeptide repeat protein n=1 Tax=Pseudomonas TaxID=286 RepID=UPI000AA09486
MMTLHNVMRNSLITLMCCASLPAFALSPQSQKNLEQLQARWAEVNYQLPKEQKEAAFASLSEQAGKALGAEPKAPELLIWHAIILSTYAGAKGGLGALSLVKDAKADLEQAIAIEPKALAGSAYTSLGSLYYQVPGWPVAFGDDDKAEQMLKQALSINPSGIDPNYFYGDFLFRDKRYAEAKTALETALAATPRPGRELADKGRRDEINKLLADVNAAMK